MNQQKQLNFLERFLGKADIFSDEALFSCVNRACPSLAKGKKKLSVNLNTGVYKCWVCGWKGRSLRPLLKPFASEEEIKSGHKLFKGIVQEQEFDFIPALPKGFLPLIENQNLTAAEPFLNYLSRRGVNEEQILQYKLGISFEDEKFKRRVIFPSFDASGFLNFVIGRSINNDCFVKYNNIDVPRGFKNSIILNELNIDFEKPLVLVEGMFDLFNAGDNATFLAGNDLSLNSKLFAKIVENQTRIYLALDSDATKFQFRLANKFYRHSVEVYIVSLGDFKDPGSMTKEQFQECISKSKSFAEKDYLLLKVRELC